MRYLSLIPNKLTRYSKSTTILVSAKCTLYGFEKTTNSWKIYKDCNDPVIIKALTDGKTTRLVCEYEKNGVTLIDVPTKKVTDYLKQTALFHRITVESKTFYGLNFHSEEGASSFFDGYSHIQVSEANLKTPNNTPSKDGVKETSKSSPGLTQSGKSPAKTEIKSPSVNNLTSKDTEKVLTKSTPGGTKKVESPVGKPGSLGKGTKSTTEKVEKEIKSEKLDSKTPGKLEVKTPKDKSKDSPKSVSSPRLEPSIATPTKLEPPKSSNTTPVTPVTKARSNSEAPSPSKSTVEKSSREKVIDEILQTEIDYNDSLDLIREVYYLPLKYATRLSVTIFANGDFEKIFYGFEMLHMLSKKLLGEFNIYKATGKLYSNVGEAFKLYAPSMKLYIDYVNKYDNTVKMIRDYAQANPLFDSYLKQGQDDPDSKGRGLTDFLIMPVQRIPRYVMLLQQLIKYTPDNHPDYSAINTGLSKISEIAGYINSQKKDYDSKTRVAEIQNLFGPKTLPLMKEGRNFIYEGIVYLVNPAFKPPEKPIKRKKNKPDPTAEQLGLKETKLFLMNDILVSGQEDPKLHFLNETGRYRLTDMNHTEPAPHYDLSFFPEGAGLYHAFTINFKESGSLTYYVYGSEEKWISELQTASLEAVKAYIQETQRKLTPSNAK